MLVIGTAGHIDHGKSALVRALTGTDPDRLPEERDRGMTIDLGFAFRTTAEGERLAFVDVPGHERFVRNMVAGAGGIDVVMLVVAADDGWMPQSQEHFQIVRLLGIRHGLIVINKIDLAEADWLALLEDDIRQRVRGSFLENAPAIRVSATTGEGIAALASHLETLPRTVAAQRDIGKARLNIDRSFVLQGIGGVATGTLRGGDLEIGQAVAVWPSRATGKIRSLRANNEEVNRARAGSRTAVSLTGVDKELLVRGGVISARTDLRHFADNLVLALSAELLAEAPVALEDRRRVLLIAGTTEMEGEVRLLGEKRIDPGEAGVVFFIPDAPMYALVGDSYILRLPTPMVTLGGGRVLDHLPHLPRRKRVADFEYLRERESPSLPALVLSELRKQTVAPRAGFLRDAAVSDAEVAATVKQLKSEGKVALSGEFAYDVGVFRAACERLQRVIAGEFEANPHLKGLSAERIGQLYGARSAVVAALLGVMVEDQVLVKAGDEYNLAGRGMALKGKILQAYQEIVGELRQQPFAPPRLADLAARSKEHRQAIGYLIDSGEGYKCGADFVFLTPAWNDITSFIREQLGRIDKLGVQELRDRFGFTRKYAIPVFEETDRLGLTRREGDFRARGVRFDQ